MEIHDFALTVVQTTDLEVKLSPPPEELTDDSPGPAFRAEGPGRPSWLRFGPRMQVLCADGNRIAKGAPRVWILT